MPGRLLSSCCLLALMLTGCTQNLAKFSLLVPGELPAAGARVEKPSSLTQAQAEDCLNYYFIFPSKSFYGLERLINESANMSPLFDVEVFRHYWMIPLIYGEDCMGIRYGKQASMGGAQ